MPIPVWQRLLGVLVYILPWSDAIQFGGLGRGGLLDQFPELRWLFLPTMPLLGVKMMIPLGLGNLLLFFVLFLAVVRNPKVPYFLRFNTLQALLVDIGIYLLSLGFLILARLQDTLIIRTFSSTVLIAVLAITIFTLIECLRGREPDLPGISEAARMQLY